jgi:hypothetical protein
MRLNKPLKGRYSQQFLGYMKERSDVGNAFLEKVFGRRRQKGDGFREF